MNISDDILIQLAQNGNEQAFNKLVELYQERIFNVCFRIIGDFHDAEEATMDTFLACYRSLANFEGKSSFATWIYRIGIRCAYKRRGKHAPKSVSIDELDISADDSSDEPYKYLRQAEIQKAIEKAMEALPDRLKEVTILHFLEGLPYRDIAEILECPIGTVGSRINTARRYMKNKLKHLIEE